MTSKYMTLALGAGFAAALALSACGRGGNNMTGGGNETAPSAETSAPETGTPATSNPGNASGATDSGSAETSTPATSSPSATTSNPSSPGG
jgi:hypothetical protein